MHHFTPSLQSLPGKWIAFEPLSILIKLPLLRGVRIVKCLIRPVNYNTAHCFSLFNYPCFHWLKQPSSHLGLVRPKLTRETKGWPASRGQHASLANAGPGRPSERSFYQQEMVFLGRWNGKSVVMQGQKMEVQNGFQLPLLIPVTRNQTVET